MLKLFLKISKYILHYKKAFKSLIYIYHIYKSLSYAIYPDKFAFILKILEKNSVFCNKFMMYPLTKKISKNFFSEILLKIYILDMKTECFI